MTDSICAGLACRSIAMVGIATLTMKASTPNMNCAATTIASTHQRRDESTEAETIWCMARPFPESAALDDRSLRSLPRLPRGEGVGVISPRLVHAKTCSGAISSRLSEFGPPAMYDYDMV